MAQAIENPETVSTASGSTDVFATGWTFEFADEVRLTVDGASQERGVDFEVAAGDWLKNGADLVFLAGRRPTAGQRVARWRETRRAQPRPFGDDATFRPVANEAAFDRLTRQSQDAARDLGQAVRVPVGETPPTPDQIVAPALALAEAADDKATAVQAVVDAALNNGITNVAGSFARFPATGSTATATGAVSAIAMGEAVADANMVKFFRNGVEQTPNVDFTVNGTTTLTPVPALVAGETWRGQHIGGQTSTSVVAFPGGRARSLTDRAGDRPMSADFVPIRMDGAWNDGPGLTAALSSARVVGHRSGVIRVNSDEIVPPSDLLLTGGQIHVVPGKTLTFSVGCRFDAPEWSHCFPGGGEVRGLTQAFPEWFGAIGDVDEALSDGGGPTDDAAAFNRAARAAQIVQCQDRAYGIGSRVRLEPTLGKAAKMRGRGWSKAGAGTRLYSMGGGANGGGVDIVGTLSLSDPSANAEWGVSDLALLTIDPVNILLDIRGDGGVTGDALTGLTSNLIENVVTGDALHSIRIGGLTKILLRNVYARSLRWGDSVLVWQPPGCSVTSEIAFEKCVLAQSNAAGAGGGRAFRLALTDVSGASEEQSQIRGITFDDDTQLYAGRNGSCIYVEAVGAEGKVRTWGDISVAEGCKLQGDLVASSAVYCDTKDGALGSSLTIEAKQIEGFNGPAAVDIRNTATTSNFGKTSDVHVSGVTFRYVSNVCIRMNGVQGGDIDTNHMQYCGAPGSDGAAVIDLISCKSVDVADNKTTATDVTSWPGLAVGVRTSGLGTVHVRTRNNALGTTTPVLTVGGPFTNSGDSADQPSVVAQVS